MLVSSSESFFGYEVKDHEKMRLVRFAVQGFFEVQGFFDRSAGHSCINVTNHHLRQPVELIHLPRINTSMLLF